MTPRPTFEQVAAVPRTHQATIPPDYLDDMGHMNVMWYTHLYSQGVRGLLGRVGIDREYIEREEAGTFALEKHLRYFREVRVGEQVSIYTRVLARNGSRFHLLQYMTNDTQRQLASTMETVSTHVDLSIRRSAPMPPPIAEAFDHLAAEHATLGWPAGECGVMAP